MIINLPTCHQIYRSCTLGQPRFNVRGAVAAKDYAAAGFETGLCVYPDVGHRFPINRDEELRKALAFVLQR